MFQAFFCSSSKKTVAFAWLGLVLLIVHGLVDTWLAIQFTDWYREFYDTCQRARPVRLYESTSGVDGSSGDPSFSELEDVLDELWRFLKLAVPAALLHPVHKWIRSHVAFAWRMVLIENYVARWKSCSSSIEGASQRVQEDTARFASTIESAFTMVLTALLSFVAFAPRLLHLGAEIPPPGYRRGHFTAWWLMIVAILLAGFGFAVTAFVAQKLVYLEVQNQKVEADLRKKLVYMEDDAHTLETTIPTTTRWVTLAGFNKTPMQLSMFLLRKNYYALFNHFMTFNLWVGVYDQIIAVVPYILVAPRLFDTNTPATLGAMIELARVFDKVFSALSVPMNNWATVNEFRSTVIRLKEFENSLPCVLIQTSKRRKVDPCDSFSVHVASDCDSNQI